MMNLELLFWAAKNGGGRNLYDMAITHALKTMENHLRGDGSTCRVVDYDSTDGHVIARETHQGLSNGSVWARGQAWANYGFTVAY
jgi:unsaturated chondroitin disaccharide hydrolase